MILELKGIYKEYLQGKMKVPVLKDVNFSMEEGEYVAIMGPSGSGKTTLMNIIGCLDKQTEGTFFLDGQDIKACSENAMSDIRLNKIGFVFQSFHLLPKQSALANVEMPLNYAKVPKKERRERALRALDRVGLSDRVDFKPNQLSGGQMQRVAIARAIVNNPKLLLADEPTSALDVTIQAQILKLMDKLVKEQGASLILITHDLAVVSQMADRIIVMYCGKIVESGSRDDVIRRPSHPYTEGLLNSIPRMGEEQKRLESIPGMVPSMLDLPQGCYFAPRCKYCQDICRTVTPENHEVSPGHCAACHFPLTGGESHE